VRLGVLGGGQLGMMIARAAAPLGITCRFLDPKHAPCAARFGEHVRGDYADPAAVERFCDGLDAATYEFENVPADAARLVADRVPLRPSVRSLEATQDRAAEKRFIESCGAAVAPWAPVDGPGDLERALGAIGRPAVLKTRRLGYDGKGQTVVREEEGLGAAREIAAGAPCVLEGFVPFTREVSVVLTRGADGAVAAHPPAENLHAGGILRASIAPAAGAEGAVPIAERLAAALDHVGAFAVEFFDAPGGLLVNEIAPRVHNSGHWTIDGAGASQFENHARAVLGLPLGDPGAASHALMLNLIGEAPPEPVILELDPDARVHLYGKGPRPGRKIGHVTLVGEPVGLAERAERLASLAGVHGPSAREAARRLAVD